MGLLDQLLSQELERQSQTPEAMQMALERARKARMAKQLQQPHLTTGPIQWDQQALQAAREQQPNVQLQGLAPWLIPGMGGLGALGVRKGLLNLLRDYRLESMFR